MTACILCDMSCITAYSITVAAQFNTTIPHLNKAVGSSSCRPSLPYISGCGCALTQIKRNKKLQSVLGFFSFYITLPEFENKKSILAEDLL